jgi:hypothetical protein
MAMLTGQSCWALVAQPLLVDYMCVQRSQSTVVVVASLFSPMASPISGRQLGIRSCEEPPRTSHHRARCGPLYHRLLVFWFRFCYVFNFEHFII